MSRTNEQSQSMMNISSTLREKYSNSQRNKPNQDEITIDTKNTKQDLSSTLVEFAVCGFLRSEFAQKYLIKGIMKIICSYTKNHGLMIHYNEAKTTFACVESSKYKTLAFDAVGNVWVNGGGLIGSCSKNTMIIGISVGHSHALLLCDDGLVKGLGSNKNGQLGHNNLQSKSFWPKIIEKLRKVKIIQISAGFHHSLVLSSNGEVFSFGSNWCGQCGAGKEKGDKILTPTKVELDEKIVFVACGHNHNLMITRKGLIYSFGNGYWGQLGYGKSNHRHTPILIKCLQHKRMKTCSAGEGHSLCVDEDGIIWSFGDDKYGQCGLPSNVKKRLTPTMIEWFGANNVKVKDCIANVNQSSVISEDGCLYAFGRSYDDSVYSKPTMIWLPTRMPIEKVLKKYDYTAIV